MNAYATTTTPISAPARSAGKVALRREALRALDESVRTLMHRRLLEGGMGRTAAFASPVMELTIYDYVYAATPVVGGHWNLAVRRPQILRHQIDSYTVTLEFDEQQRPARFQVTGAKDVVSDDATLEALDRALVRAAAAGPQRTSAPSFMPGISL